MSGWKAWEGESTSVYRVKKIPLTFVWSWGLSLLILMLVSTGGPQQIHVLHPTEAPSVGDGYTITDVFVKALFTATTTKEINTSSFLTLGVSSQASGDMLPPH